MSTVIRFAILICTLSFSSVWRKSTSIPPVCSIEPMLTVRAEPINGSWLSINAASPAERSITLALFVGATNVGGIFGSQLFQPGDAPDYHTGWSAIVGLQSLSLVCIVLAAANYYRLNRKNGRFNGSGLEIVEGKRVKYWL